MATAFPLRGSNSDGARVSTCARGLKPKCSLACVRQNEVDRTCRGYARYVVGRSYTPATHLRLRETAGVSATNIPSRPPRASHARGEGRREGMGRRPIRGRGVPALSGLHSRDTPCLRLIRLPELTRSLQAAPSPLRPSGLASAHEYTRNTCTRAHRENERERERERAQSARRDRRRGRYRRLAGATRYGRGAGNQAKPREPGHASAAAQHPDPRPRTPPSERSGCINCSQCLAAAVGSLAGVGSGMLAKCGLRSFPSTEPG
jgi:hypothetical protein